ncbi:MAG: LytTR family DNA-binding domain-containing protein [Prolixibacteraceae bacterium]|nr:LytTR family DNA-binding domain-containing protein [Prolixibacteraceae bacterium]
MNKRMLKVLIVDDEEHVRAMLVNILQSFCPDLEIVGQAGDVAGAVSKIKELKPDLALLDINLPDGNGFDVLKAFSKVDFSVIFVTAYDEYAVKAFKCSALDYILKPFNIDELVETIEKARESIANKNLAKKIAAFLDNLNSNSPDEKKIVLKTQESIHIVKVSTIIRCESFHNYTEFHIAGAKKLVVSKTLKEYETLLCGFGFFRVHQSHLINVNYINRFDKTDGGYLVLADGSQVPVAKRKKDELLHLFEKM